MLCQRFPSDAITFGLRDLWVLPSRRNQCDFARAKRMVRATDNSNPGSGLSRILALELGAGISAWKKGQRVGVGWHGGQDNTCPSCRRGDFRNCRNLKIPGISYDGGYQQYMVAPAEALAAIPESLSDVEAAPLLCAGITTYNALRHSGAMPGDLVAVQGVGGLGHLGIQFANKFGYKVAAIGRGSENAALAKKLGASVYIEGRRSHIKSISSGFPFRASPAPGLVVRPVPEDG